MDIPEFPEVKEINSKLLKELTGGDVTYFRSLSEEYGKVDKKFFKVNLDEFKKVRHGIKVYTLTYQSQSRKHSDTETIGVYATLELAKKYMNREIIQNDAYTDDHYHIEKCSGNNPSEVLCYQFTDGGNCNFEIYTITETNVIID